MFTSLCASKDTLPTLLLSGVSEFWFCNHMRSATTVLAYSYFLLSSIPDGMVCTPNLTGVICWSNKDKDHRHRNCRCAAKGGSPTVHRSVSHIGDLLQTEFAIKESIPVHWHSWTLVFLCSIPRTSWCGSLWKGLLYRCISTPIYYLLERFIAISTHFFGCTTNGYPTLQLYDPWHAGTLSA